MKTAMVCLILAAAGLWANKATSMDGEEVYKSNCTRCHITIHTYPARMSRSIVRHMRIKGLLTKKEADAVQSYLIDAYNPPHKRGVEQ